MNLTLEEIKDTITALQGYDFFLLQVSKSKVRPIKERNRAKEDMIVIDNLIQKFKKIEKEKF